MGNVGVTGQVFYPKKIDWVREAQDRAIKDLSQIAIVAEAQFQRGVTYQIRTSRPARRRRLRFVRS
jgi:hypothetical protein